MGGMRRVQALAVVSVVAFATTVQLRDEPAAPSARTPPLRHSRGETVCSTAALPPPGLEVALAAVVDVVPNPGRTDGTALRLDLRTVAGEPLSAPGVCVSAGMPARPEVAPVGGEAREVGPGRYLLITRLPAGTWTATATVTLPGGALVSLPFEFDVR